ncbi:hypothetical protein CFOL_v3_28302 [Cephalotus follicularis]|uniref:SecE domain-containing protein n=1 Tax=Cephalotus follicularis TaxID=3775 RepID=A0A1Q3CXA2_CEPFO|nr:hypothetical protein CFOL_v3_28302 [Cephalotus follicularis]
MALSLQIPFSSTILTPPYSPARFTSSRVSQLLKTRTPHLLKITKMPKKGQPQILKAMEEDKESVESETTKQQKQQTEVVSEESDDLSELGEEIKKAMRKSDFWGGVAEEIKEIEWPVFGKVLGTTGLVLGVITGSSVVLLTVNFVLAELSDKVFAGRGVQDFFS